ncbi:unnamed protein product [Rotaria sp. Silwood2]|nr:unnamed protein product [Rotaria sp. Silwood2]CAF4280359.1 unnamed protein product [Rotaria sp. Silwood2]
MTSHLESLKPKAHERIRQLKYCFRKMLEASRNRIVFFGGDLNLHDNELRQAGDIPTGIYDVWIETGQNLRYAYTWDMKWNTNLSFESSNPPRFRFDRLYFRPARSTMFNLSPASFKLKGQQMIPSIQRFCSDHWAIQAKFKISPSS